MRSDRLGLIARLTKLSTILLLLLGFAASAVSFRGMAPMLGLMLFINVPATYYFRARAAGEDTVFFDIEIYSATSASTKLWVDLCVLFSVIAGEFFVLLRALQLLIGWNGLNLVNP